MVKDFQNPDTKESRIEPYLMAVLSSRFEAINREMTNTLLRSARSAVLAIARDFSCAVTDANARLVSVAEGLPVHTGTSHMIVEPVLELHGDNLKPGDCYFNNSAYYGGNHLADFTVTVPVFYKDKLMFFTNNRAHQADCGHPVPTTYSYWAKDVYEEGPHLPCVKIQENYKDIDDLIRILRTNIRSPDVWYGDYLAGLGAARIGERRIIELCDKYGVDTIIAFSEDWQEYGRKRMIEAIRSLPAITCEGEDWHDSVPGVAPEGIPIRAKVTVDPKEAYVTVDLRDNIDNVPGGFNSTEATATALALAGVFNVLDPSLPHNEGANSRIKVLLREGACIGKPKFPAGTGVATTDLVDRLVNLITKLLTDELGYPHGMAQAGTGMNFAPVVSGIDRRHGNRPYVNQMITSTNGGGARSSSDGWVTNSIPVTAGMMNIGSVEVHEQLYPLTFEVNEIAQDSAGAGERDGGPGGLSVIGPRFDTATMVTVSDTVEYPVKGSFGGADAPASLVQKFNIETPDQKENVTPTGVHELETYERMYFRNGGGGGYGDPLDRKPELVRHRAREGWISLERARDVYGVVLEVDSEMFTVDKSATETLRKQMRKRTSDQTTT